MWPQSYSFAYSAYSYFNLHSLYNVAFSRIRIDWFNEMGLTWYLVISSNQEMPQVIFSRCQAQRSLNTINSVQVIGAAALVVAFDCD